MKRQQNLEKCQDSRRDPILFGLAVRGELVEPLATHPEPFDRLRSNGGCIKRTVLRRDLSFALGF